ncbi:MAG: phosphomannomutase/phosphoglucomutase [Pseudomonadota bacterium]
MMKISSIPFREYDIRGIVDEQLDETLVEQIGRALGTMLVAKGQPSLFVARDGRLSGPKLVTALKKGLLSTGCDVIDIGQVPTPLLYFAVNNYPTKSGVVLTGSHNPANYNGLKIAVDGKTLSGQAIRDLYQAVCDGKFAQGQGRESTQDIVSDYIERVCNDVKLSRPLKLVIDSGHGIAGAVAPALYRRLGCEVVELYCDVDGHFPHHHPDPGCPENLQDLIKKVAEVQADIGLAFDGDADRLGVITDTGTIIWPDRQLVLFALDVLKRQPGAEIIYDVKSTYHLDAIIKKAGGKPTMWKTGHSLIKQKLIDSGAALAGELSGHIFFKERWYGFDDGLYAGARLLEILAQSDQSISALFADIPDSVNTPELKIQVSEQQKQPLMRKILECFHPPGAERVTIDGLRLVFKNGWGLIRPSNTTACLTLRFEADNADHLAEIQTIFRQQLLAIQPDLSLPF